MAEEEIQEQEQQEQQVDTAESKAIESSQAFDKKLSNTYDGDDDDPGADDNKPEGDDKNAAPDKVADDDSGDKKEQSEEQQIPDELLTRAVRAGLDLSHARSFTDAGALERTVELLENNASASDEDDRQKEDKTQQQVQEGPLKPFEFEALEIKFENEAEVDPEIVKTVKGVNEHYAKQFQAMNSYYSGAVRTLVNEVVALRTELTETSTVSRTEKFDGQIASLGTEFESVFGKGGIDEIDRNSPSFANRSKLWDEIKVLEKGYKAQGKPVPNYKTLFNKALQSAFGGHVKDAEGKKVALQITRRDKLRINPPSGSDGKQLTKDEKLVKASEDFDKKLES
jgi:hypothetical protein